MTLRLRSAPPDCHHGVGKRVTSHPDEGDELLIGVFITPGKSRALEMQTAASAQPRCLLTSCVCR